jgi:hypothetical protein
VKSAILKTAHVLTAIGKSKFSIPSAVVTAVLADMPSAIGPSGRAISASLAIPKLTLI